MKAAAREHRGYVWLLLGLSLLAAAWGAWHASVPPPARAADAPAAVFAAGRAMIDVRAIGQAPHPVGSAEHARVRTRLIARMARLGLQPRVIAGRAVKIKPGADGTAVEGAEVMNLIGRLPGRDSHASAILLMAHYDSVPSSPGAADDGAGVAAALEIARALRATGALRRDVLFLFTDAEENGLLGARAFFASAEARRIGFVVNMDMRGGGGRAIMHETGRASGGAIDLYRRSAIHPTTDSIAAYVERLIRNSSDFRIAVDHGLPGLNFAILDRQFDYHAASSTPARLDERSLQQLGDQVLPVVRSAAMAAELPLPSPDPAYASIFGQFVIAYPAWAGWLILGLGGVFAGLAWRRSDVRSGEMLRAFGAALHLLLLVLILSLARVATGVPFGFTVGRPLLARWDVYEAALGLLCAACVLLWWGAAQRGARRPAVAAPVVIGASFLIAGGSGWIVPAMAAVAMLLAVPCFTRPIPTRALPTGLWLAVTLLATAVQALAPAAAVTLGWAVAAGGLALFAATSRSRGGIALAAFVAALLVGQQVATAHLLLLAVGETIAGVAAPFAWCIALMLAPLLARILTPRWCLRLGVPLAIVAGLLILLIRVGDPASTTRPAVSQILHVSDVASGRFYRATSLVRPDAWTLAALGRPVVAVPLPPFYDHAFLAPAEPVAAAPPAINMTRLPDGTNALRIVGPPGTREIRMILSATVPMRQVRVNGIVVPLLARGGRADRLSWVGRDPVVTLLLAPTAPGRLVARIATLRDGWPGDARPLPPRPPTTMPWYASDAALTLSTLSLAW